MIWSRVRQVNTLRSLLREYYPAALAAFGTHLAGRDALAVLTVAPNPDLGRRLPRSDRNPAAACRPTAQHLRTAATVRAALSSEQLTARPGVIRAYTASAAALLAVLTTTAAQTKVLAGQVKLGLEQAPEDAQESSTARTSATVPSSVPGC